MYCQKCRVPLRLDSTLEDLNPTAFNLLINGPAHPISSKEYSHGQESYSKEQRQLYEEASKEAGAPLFKRNIGLPRHGGKSITDMSFVMLTESQILPPQTAEQASPKNVAAHEPRSNSQRGNNLLSERMETTQRLFEILSSRSDIDHPICAECTDLLISGMENRLANATKERDAYAEYLRNATADVPTDEERALARKELEVLKEQEKHAFAELEQLETEKAKLEDEIAALELESQELDEEEDAFWRERNALAQAQERYYEEQDSLSMRLEHDAKQLERLKRTNVFNDTFYISQDADMFATINGLRLGRGPTTGRQVEWSEINAAWGQAMLLLVVVAERLGFTFQGYRLNPMGSTSSIDKIETLSPSSSRRDPSSQAQSSDTKGSVRNLPLYNSSDLLSDYFHAPFDNGMIAFLECLRQLGKHVERTTQGTGDGGDGVLRLPYEIKKDKIGDLSIKLGGFGGDENWTRACKLTLTCCKFLLAHTSNLNDERKTNK